MRHSFSHYWPAYLALFLGSILLALAVMWKFPHLFAPAAVIVPTEDPSTIPWETLPPQPAAPPPITEPTQIAQYQYFEVEDSCGPYYQGTCAVMRSGPGTEYPVVLRMRNGMVLKVKSSVVGKDGTEWYEIEQDASLRYPERIKSNWYVSSEVVHAFNDDGDHRIQKGEKPTTTKRIVVDLDKQMLYAYDGDTLFMEQAISTGLSETPTPRGTFTVYYMTPSRYMQGPIEGVSSQAYDLPGVPWNMYFTNEGAVIHGAYWHDHFGHPWSHGCVNLPPEKAKELYFWADLGTTVTIK